MYKRSTNRILITFKIIGYKLRRETFESKNNTTLNYSIPSTYKVTIFLNKEENK